VVQLELHLKHRSLLMKYPSVQGVQVLLSKETAPTLQLVQWVAFILQVLQEESHRWNLPRTDSKKYPSVSIMHTGLSTAKKYPVRQVMQLPVTLAHTLQSAWQ
jgi:hypothetical protein